MVYLALGVLLLVVVLWLLRIFTEADPAKLARGAGRFGLVLCAAVAVALLIALLASGRVVPALVEVGGLAPLLLRGRVLWRRWQAVGGPLPGQISEVETEFLRMRLDHDSGAMSGTVRRGHFQGRRLNELSHPELIVLWRECRADDEPGANLLEAYLDRLMPGWRAAAAEGGAGAGASQAADAMTKEEARAILGLTAGAEESEIREAHRRLMMKLHPDHGGSTYLAAKLNRAREALLDG